MSEDFFIKQSEVFLASEGATKEVAILANSFSKVEQTDSDNWNGGTNLYTLFLEISIPFFVQVQNEIEVIQQNIALKLNQVIPDGSNNYFRNVAISAQLSNDPNWREKAKNWLSGSHVNNQGKIRSDNITSRVCDGLLFRSQPEIFFYKAVKSLGVSFAPLPVFIRGGEKYQRIEPDFFIIKDGLMLVVEVDGDTVHQETPAEAHDRTTMLLHEGVYFERVRASECDTFEKALDCAKKVIGIIERHKASR